MHANTNPSKIYRLLPHYPPRGPLNDVEPERKNSPPWFLVQLRLPRQRPSTPCRIIARLKAKVGSLLFIALACCFHNTKTPVEADLCDLIFARRRPVPSHPFPLFLSQLLLAPRCCCLPYYANELNCGTATLRSYLCAPATPAIQDLDNHTPSQQKLKESSHP